MVLRLVGRSFIMFTHLEVGYQPRLKDILQFYYLDCIKLLCSHLFLTLPLVLDILLAVAVDLTASIQSGAGYVRPETKYINWGGGGTCFSVCLES